VVDGTWQQPLWQTNSQLVVAYTGNESSILPLTLIWREDQYVSFLVGEDGGNTSIVDVSHLMLVSWKIDVSGLKGQAKCSAYTNAESAP
jgi:hypothetical protein